MNFTLLLQEGQKKYRVEVTQSQANDWTEQYTISAGTKTLVLRNNRPEMKRYERKGRLKWEIVSKDFAIDDFKAATEWIIRIQDLIEQKLDPPPTFQQSRNKQ